MFLLSISTNGFAPDLQNHMIITSLLCIFMSYFGLGLA